jgi:RNA polymerase sigma-70 factor, ECF subfamily
VGGWFTICRHAYLRTHSRERRQVACDDPELEALAAAALHTSAVHGGYADLFATVDLTDAVDRALARLPDEFREAIVLVDLEDQSYTAASGILGVPVGTVRSRLFRGRRLLQEALLAYARDAGLVRDASDDRPGMDLDR